MWSGSPCPKSLRSEVSVPALAAGKTASFYPFKNKPSSDNKQEPLTTCACLRVVFVSEHGQILGQKGTLGLGEGEGEVGM